MIIPLLIGFGLVACPKTLLRTLNAIGALTIAFYCIVLLGVILL